MRKRTVFFRNDWRSMLLLCVATLLPIPLCSCAQTENETVQVAGLSELGAIHLVAREDGSGTRSAFAQLLAFDRASETGASDLTADTAEIVESTEEVIATVAEDKAAIGYVSLASLTETDAVKVLDVDGYAVDSEKYPLERTFYLTYVGTLNTLQTDFLRYVTSEGQEIVAASYETVSESQSFLSEKPEGLLLIGGSTSAAPLLQELAQNYETLNPNAEITVIESDSTDGLTGAMAGTYDFGMASRELETYEAELLEQTSIAIDKIAVIVQEDNPLDSISSDMLYAIYTGEMTSWEDVNDKQ